MSKYNRNDPVSPYYYTPRRGIRVLAWFTVIVIIGSIILVLILQGCAPAPTSIPVISNAVITNAPAQSESSAEKVVFFSDNGSGMVCAAIRAPSGALRELTCAVK
jgi:hypothetical protein